MVHGEIVVISREPQIIYVFLENILNFKRERERFPCREKRAAMPSSLFLLLVQYDVVLLIALGRITLIAQLGYGVQTPWSNQPYKNSSYFHFQLIL